MDLSKLMVPHDSNDVVAELQDWRAAHPEKGLDLVHVFPLGGIKASAEWMEKERQAV